MHKVKQDLLCKYYWTSVYMKSVNKDAWTFFFASVAKFTKLGIIPQMWLRALTNRLVKSENSPIKIF